MNSILIIFLEDGEKIVNSFKIGISEKEALEKFFSHNPNAKIKRKFFIEKADKGCAYYQDYYDLNDKNELEYDKRQHIIQLKIVRIREQRDALLEKLDIPFMRAIEEKCDECMEEIIKIKNFLRDVPKNLEFRKIEDEESLIKYHPFNNIFYITVLDKGSGYVDPPQVTISAPINDRYFGFQAQAIASIKDGSISKVDVIYPGCGYARSPIVTVEGNAQLMPNSPYNSFESVGELEAYDLVTEYFESDKIYSQEEVESTYQNLYKTYDKWAPKD